MYKTWISNRNLYKQTLKKQKKKKRNETSSTEEVQRVKNDKYKWKFLFHQGKISFHFILETFSREFVWK